MTAQSPEPPYFTTESGRPRCAKRTASPAVTVIAISTREIAKGLGRTIVSEAGAPASCPAARVHGDGRFGAIIHFHGFRKPSEEEMKVAAQDDVRGQACDRLRLKTFHQVPAQGFERELALRKWALIEGGQNLPRFDERHKVSKQVGCDQFDLPPHSVFVDGAENGNTV